MVQSKQKLEKMYAHVHFFVCHSKTIEKILITFDIWGFYIVPEHSN